MALIAAVLLAILGSHAHARCPLGFVQGRDDGAFAVCYYYINQPLTWFQAEVECNLMKAHLTSIKDHDENVFLSGSARSTEAPRQNFWTGGSRDIQGGSAVNWTWIDGELFTFTQWAVGQPAAHPQRSCIWLAATSAKGTWVVDNCTKTLPAICKVRYEPDACETPTASTNHPLSTHPSGTPKVVYKCPTGFMQGPEDASQPGCFYFFMQPMVWLSAEAECNQRSGHLASIEDLVTNNFIAGNAHVSSIWVGGSVGIRTAGDWTWSDGSPFAFTYWPAGRPIKNMSLACLHVDTHFGWWHPDNCTFTFPAVCKVRPSTESCGPAEDPTTTPSCVCPTYHGILPHSSSEVSTLAVTTTSKPKLSSADKWLVPVVIGCFVSFLVLTLLATICAYRCGLRNHAVKHNPVVTFPETTHGSASAVPCGGRRTSITHDQQSHVIVNIPSKDVHVSAELLGKGKFSDVFKGFYTPSTSSFTNFPAICDADDDIRKTVVVKLIRDHAAPVLSAGVVYEANLMQQLGSSKYTLLLFGLTCVNDSLAIVVEFCENRDLLSFLRTNLSTHKKTVERLNEGLQRRPYVNTDLSLVDLVQFSWQISDGMSFLHLRNYVHRGLRAAKVLVTSKLVAKISGFGLGSYSDKDLHAENLRQKKPMKWMAPESLVSAYFSTESDV